ncbi:MAG: asparagine synthase (glutamine-hydrolyzing) [Planctomycetota bacterium]|nr:asparagine synthase (glutamine-hydrolyzing) [Planctomycetota bacterium]
MCGIGGILRTDGEPIPEEWLDAIDARIAYRGPDGEGRFRDRVEVDTPDGKKTVEVAFVHRRLSIIDHASGGQPMVSERGRTDEEGLVAVVFNGCIYNHRELRKELEAAGHRFATDHSDTEVLIHGWREWGANVIKHLEGMYAFAIWDRHAVSLYLARDAFGEKPLYYRNTQTPSAPTVAAPVIGFASDASSLWHYPPPDPVADDECRYGWLVSYLLLGYGLLRPLPGPDPVGVHEMSPGTGDLFRGEEADPGCEFTGSDLVEWKPSARPIEDLLDDAVHRRLEADVPLGCFLSGGVDSSLIAHFAKKHKPDLRTFSVRMPDPRYDESHHAEQVAAHIGTDHTTLDCDPKPADDLVYLINLLGQPFADSSILPTYWVSRAAREHVKVAIAGDGGDELFVGYERYMAARFLRRHWRWLRLLPPRILKRFHPKSRLHKLGRLGDMARDYPRLGIATMESIFTQRGINELLSLPSPPGRGAGGESGRAMAEGLEELADSPSPGSLRSPPSPRGRGEDALAALRLCDIEHYLPNDLLRKVDTASMAVALEVRCPFLDRDLAAAVLAMPVDDLIPGGTRKGLLRNIARRYLPAEVVDRPKMGFAIPIGEWFRSDYGSMKTLLLDHLQSAEPFGPIRLDRKAVQRFIDEHMSGKRDHGQRLFALLTLSIRARSLQEPARSAPGRYPDRP